MPMSSRFCNSNVAAKAPPAGASKVLEMAKTGRTIQASENRFKVIPFLRWTGWPMRTGSGRGCSSGECGRPRTSGTRILTENGPKSAGVGPDSRQSLAGLRRCGEAVFGKLRTRQAESSRRAGLPRHPFRQRISELFSRGPFVVAEAKRRAPHEVDARDRRAPILSTCSTTRSVPQSD